MEAVELVGEGEVPVFNTGDAVNDDEDYFAVEDDGDEALDFPDFFKQFLYLMLIAIHVFFCQFLLTL